MLRVPDVSEQSLAGRRRGTAHSMCRTSRCNIARPCSRIRALAGIRIIGIQITIFIRHESDHGQDSSQKQATSPFLGREHQNKWVAFPTERLG